MNVLDPQYAFAPLSNVPIIRIKLYLDPLDFQLTFMLHYTTSHGDPLWCRSHLPKNQITYINISSLGYNGNTNKINLLGQRYFSILLNLPSARSFAAPEFFLGVWDRWCSSDQGGFHPSPGCWGPVQYIIQQFSACPVLTQYFGQSVRRVRTFARFHCCAPIWNGFPSPKGDENVCVGGISSRVIQWDILFFF